VVFYQGFTYLKQCNKTRRTPSGQKYPAADGTGAYMVRYILAVSTCIDGEACPEQAGEFTIGEGVSNLFGTGGPIFKIISNSIYEFEFAQSVNLICSI